VGRIDLCDNKFLKLTNVLIRELPKNNEIDASRITYMMSAYVKSKGILTRGPFISYSCSGKEIDNNFPIIRRHLIVQLSEPLHQCEAPYIFTPILRTERCLFARFSGYLKDAHNAYAKIGVYAFENDIELDGSCYSIHTNQDGDKTCLDVFMPIRNEDAANEAIFSE
jgi:hypothetical protein